MATQSKATKTTKRKTLTDEEREWQRAEKAKKFVELAEARVGNVLKRLRQIENLGNYPHTEEQTRAIMRAIDDAVSKVRNSLANMGKKAATAFSLSNGDAEPS